MNNKLNLNNVTVDLDDALEGISIPTVEETMEMIPDDAVFAAPEKEEKEGDKKKKSKDKKDYILGGKINASTWQEFQTAMKEAGLKIGHKSFDVLSLEYEELMAQKQQEQVEVQGTQAQETQAETQQTEQEKVQTETEAPETQEKVEEQKILSDKDIFYGKGGVKGLLYWSSQNKNNNFISGFMLESVVAELITGKRLMNNGIAVSFSDAERKEVKEVVNTFKKKYLKELNGCRGYGYDAYKRKEVSYATVLTIMGHNGLPSMDMLQKYIYFAATGDVMPPKGKEVKQDILDRCKDIQRFLINNNVLAKSENGWGINVWKAKATLTELYNKLGW